MVVSGLVCLATWLGCFACLPACRQRQDPRRPPVLPSLLRSDSAIDGHWTASVDSCRWILYLAHARAAGGGIERHPCVQKCRTRYILGTYTEERFSFGLDKSSDRYQVMPRLAGCCGPGCR
ncbi:uncharacterized protein J3D65DRAFT_640898 [Phyllosticta citribraziliensis]|uniref:Secreted protein n=1 Tax=Phyllosticta citribraziliensis TaxID=989973 RepID=A0ABR1L526_9PEZI